MTEPENPHRVVIVQCTGQKRDGVHPAGDLYDESDYFRKQRAYARVCADEWYIQSAKHGLLHPLDEVESYDMHAKDIENPEAWAGAIAAELDDRVPDEAVIEILGGMSYSDPLTPELERLGYETLEPLRGNKIGERKASLMRMVDQNREWVA